MRCLICGLLATLLMACSGCGAAEESRALRLAQTIPLPEVSGRIDHMAADVAGSRTSLFAPRLDRLYLAVPASRVRHAELRVYEALP